ncbi:MAG: hypothetical protein JOS17DRAFT_804686 [Linnemannia elongata]|nr:MAG: hypothetical protein JOS17DRAFT_804686 [Linnemannia elongata]
MHIRALPFLVAVIASTLAMTNAVRVIFYPCDSNADRSGVVVSDLECDEELLKVGKFWRQSNGDWLAPPNKCINFAKQKIQYTTAQIFLNQAHACVNVDDATYETRKFFNGYADGQRERCLFSVQDRYYS